MQAAEMMRDTRAICCDLVFLLSLSISYVHSFPLQVLPTIQGYIPVYIRYGNQPLEEINPKLAEAFHEGSSTRYADSPMNNLNKKLDLDLANDENDEKLTEEDLERKSAANVIREVQETWKVDPLIEEGKNVEERDKSDRVKGDRVKSPNNIHDSNFHLAESSMDKYRYKNDQTFTSNTNVDQMIAQESIQSDIYEDERRVEDSTSDS
ncbi:uncharacterized protein LOC100870461 [Apis florea]|uniref:uncharacterized protein LOC100870461 n=1 Tax=Apis florea TaxID=7463 RepID=UPI000252B39F|nr:uncharacterized protein LOC100870461 [Apis florea]